MLTDGALISPLNPGAVHGGELCSPVLRPHPGLSPEVSDAGAKAGELADLAGTDVIADRRFPDPRTFEPQPYPALTNPVQSPDSASETRSFSPN